MKVQMQVYKKFLTKKKLSNFAWTHWGFALITTIGIGFLFTIIELVKLHDDKNVAFFNLRTVNTENNKQMKIENETTLNNSSPVFVFLKDNVLFGTLKSIIAPLPNNDVIILSKNWKDDFRIKIDGYKYKNNIFPAKAFGVVFEYDLSYLQNIDTLNKTFELIISENRNITKGLSSIYPSLVLLDTIKLH